MVFRTSDSIQLRSVITRRQEVSPGGENPQTLTQAVIVLQPTKEVRWNHNKFSINPKEGRRRGKGTKKKWEEK